MCYTLLVSTTSPEDLTIHNNALVRFSADLTEIPEPNKLQFTHRWYVGSKSGCSCTFRHLHSTELGFGPPVDWYPEEPDEIEATRQVARIIRQLIMDGHQVDCLDAWMGGDALPAHLELLEVNLAAVTDEEFRFFENHYFVFTDSLIWANG